MKNTTSTATVVLVSFGFLCGIFILLAMTDFTTVLPGKRNDIEHRIEPCDPEICGQQCYNNYYMNAWCESSLCYCDNDCARHRRLYPWDDVTATCGHLCNYKHGPCTGSGCANDSYWINSTHAEYDLSWNTTTWLLEPNNTWWIFEHFFFNSTVCLCYDNGTEEEYTTEAPSSSEWLIGFPLDSSEEYSESSQEEGSETSSGSSSELSTSSDESTLNQHHNPGGSMESRPSSSVGMHDISSSSSDESQEFLENNLKEIDGRSEGGISPQHDKYDSEYNSERSGISGESSESSRRESSEHSPGSSSSDSKSSQVTIETAQHSSSESMEIGS